MRFSSFSSLLFFIFIFIPQCFSFGKAKAGPASNHCPSFSVCVVVHDEISEIRIISKAKFCCYSIKVIHERDAGELIDFGGNFEIFVLSIRLELFGGRAHLHGMSWILVSYDVGKGGGRRG